MYTCIYKLYLFRRKLNITFPQPLIALFYVKTVYKNILFIWNNTFLVNLNQNKLNQVNFVVQNIFNDILNNGEWYTFYFEDHGKKKQKLVRALMS